MNYSLGNMLGKNNGSLNPDKLSLNLQFATDKSLTARKGPTPVFTRASTATFVGSNGLIQSAAIDVARFDHDPITLACRGLLIEESRTNVMLRSQDFSQSMWTKTNSTISGTLYTDPSGTSTANELVEDVLSAAHTCQQGTGTSATIGSTYTFSLFVKRKTSSNQFLLIGASGLVSAAFMSVNLTNGVTATGIGSPAAPINVSSTAYPNGWYRVQFSVVATAAASITLDIRLSRDGTWANRSYLGDGVQSSLVWGAQVEVGSFPTSYIPTTTASVVRSADLCSISGSNFTGFWNQSAGTLVETFEASPNTNTTYASASNGNIVQNSLHLDNDTGLMRAVYYSGSAIVATLDLGAVGTVGTVNTIATAYSVNDFAASRNGGTVVTDTSGAVPASLSQINIGADERSQTPTSFYSNRCIKSLRYYKKRLANAKLQTLST
jgi:hypothetical protein